MKISIDKVINTLKDKIDLESDLADIWNYYLTEVSSTRNFMKAGKLIHNTMLQNILIKISQDILEQTITSEHVLMLIMKIKKYALYHGSCLVAKKMFSLLFFSDINKGIIAIPFTLKTCNTKYIRFTGISTQENKIIMPMYQKYQRV